MKFFIPIFLFLHVSYTTLAQWGPPYSNSWINFSENYVKIKIQEEGVYRIAVADLPKDFTFSNPDYLSLFWRGREIPLIKADNSSIIFYGLANDGAPDSLLYRPMADRVNKYSSLFSDITSYFLTVGKSKGLRVKEQNLDPGLVTQGQGFHIAEDLAVYKKEYSLSTSTAIYAKHLNSFYEHGASRTGERVIRDTMVVTTVQTENLVRIADNTVKIELMFHGRSNVSRNIDIYIGETREKLRKVKSLPIEEFSVGKVEISIDNADIDLTGKFWLGYKSTSTSSTERYSLSYRKVSYPQVLEISADMSKIFRFRTLKGNRYKYSLGNIPSGTMLLDITDTNNPAFVTMSGQNMIFDGKISGMTKILASNDLRQVAASQMGFVKFISRDLTKNNFVIITSEDLLDGATKYAEYRSSTAGGGYTPLIINIEELYDQFNYGETSPLAIRRFVDYMLADRNRSRYLFLIGKSTSYFERRPADLKGDVPTVGYPGSDILLVEGLAGASKDVPVIPIGRLAAFSNEHVLTYLNKVKEFEQGKTVSYDWMKKVLHLNGGKSVGEITSFRDELAALGKVVRTGPVGGDVEAFVKRSLIEVESVDISAEVNNGVGMISYVGHGAATVTDLDFGYASAPERGYQNKGKYPFLYYNGCGVGNIFTGRYSTNLSSPEKIPMSLDWLIAKDKGAISIVANTFESYAGPSLSYLEKLYETMFSRSNLDDKMSVGRLQQKTIEQVLAAGADAMDITNIHQSLLQGDPSLQLIRVDKPDYSGEAGMTILAGGKPGQLLSQSDSVKIRVILSNLGKYIDNQKIKLQLTIVKRNGSSYPITLDRNGVAFRDTLVLTVPNLKADWSRVELVVDPTNLIPELSEENNSSSLNIDWNVAGGLTSYGASSVKDIVPPILQVYLNGSLIEDNTQYDPNVVVTFDVSDDRQIDAGSSNIEIFLKRCNDSSCEFEALPFGSNVSVLKTSTNTFRVTANLSDLSQGNYILRSSARDNSGNKSSAYQVGFSIAESSVSNEFLTSFVVSPNPANTYVRFNGVFAKKSQTLIWGIYDLTGKTIKTGQLNIVTSGKLEWYWNTEGVQNGLYVYKIHCLNEGRVIKTTSGKIVVAK